MFADSTDLTITHDSELMVAQVEGNTDEGIEFLDAYTPASPATEYSVVDSGRLIFPEAAISDVLASARERHLTWEEVPA